MGKKKKEKPNRSWDEFFFSKDSISNSHSPKRTQWHREPVNELAVDCLFPGAGFPTDRPCVDLKRMNEKLNEKCAAESFSQCRCTLADGCSCGHRGDRELWPDEALVAKEWKPDRGLSVIHIPGNQFVELVWPIITIQQRTDLKHQAWVHPSQAVLSPECFSLEQTEPQRCPLFRTVWLYQPPLRCQVSDFYGIRNWRGTVFFKGLALEDPHSLKPSMLHCQTSTGSWSL